VRPLLLLVDNHIPRCATYRCSTHRLELRDAECRFRVVNGALGAGVPLPREGSTPAEGAPSACLEHSTASGPSLLLFARGAVASRPRIGELEALPLRSRGPCGAGRRDAVVPFIVAVASAAGEPARSTALIIWCALDT
jgi:hypothetical protein